MLYYTVYKMLCSTAEEISVLPQLKLVERGALGLYMVSLSPLKGFFIVVSSNCPQYCPYIPNKQKMFK